MPTLAAILILYLRWSLLFDDNTSTVLFHSFVVLCYFSPIFGAIISDSWLGKYKTILYVSLVYALGNTVLSVSAIGMSAFPKLEMSMLGLLLIGLGTGGIKPCVAAFGGDQFRLPEQERELRSFFSLFYFCINAGSTISTFLTPILRENVHCLGEKECYPLAFGVPALLMVLAIVIFVIGKPYYKIYPPSGNVLVRVMGCIVRATSGKLKNIGKPKLHQHWLQHASDKYDQALIRDVSTLLNILLLYLPLPIFWALYDQQATKMDGSIGGGVVIKPDQMQIINPILIMVLIPLFDAGIYPFLNKFGILVMPLQKIVTGGLLAAVAFIASGLVERSIEGTSAILPRDGFSRLHIMNGLNCSVQLNTSWIAQEELKKMEPFGSAIFADIPVNSSHSVVLSVSPPCAGAAGMAGDEISFLLKNRQNAAAMLLGKKGGGSSLQFLPEDDTTLKTNYPKIRLHFPERGKTSKVILQAADGEVFTFPFSKAQTTTSYVQVSSTSYAVQLVDRQNQRSDGGHLTFQPGAIYNIYLTEVSPGSYISVPYEVAPPNSVSMLWLLPQYIIITVAEIMFSITCLEFSFTQAPKSMKAVMQSIYLMTTAIGSLIVIIIAELRIFEKQSREFFLFAILMMLDMILFAILSFFYKYRSAEDQADVPEGDLGGGEDEKKTLGFVNAMYTENE